MLRALVEENFSEKTLVIVSTESPTFTGKRDSASSLNTISCTHENRAGRPVVLQISMVKRSVDEHKVAYRASS